MEFTYWLKKNDLTINFEQYIYIKVSLTDIYLLLNRVNKEYNILHYIYC